jgi:hypothetical protein
MQDRYVGDVGDFGKYALLRRLCGIPGEAAMRLGVVWCYFPDEDGSNDGQHIGYLRAPEFINLDDELRLKLRCIVDAKQRAISAISNSAVFPEGTVFCNGLLPDGGQRPIETRIHHRRVWLDACLGLTSTCELVFFDPDNGLEVASIPKLHPKAGKYIFWDELIPFWNRKNSLLIYHHLNRTTSAARQVEVLARRFAVELDGAMIVPLVFRRGSSRVFWLIHHDDNLGRELERRAADLLSGGWSRHFRPFGWPGNDQASTRSR